ncbi:hypothetical protein ACQUSW_06400 [Microbacterium sp. YY-01]
MLAVLAVIFSLVANVSCAGLLAGRPSVLQYLGYPAGMMRSGVGMFRCCLPATIVGWSILTR